MRYDCPIPENCYVVVATVGAQGSCEALEEYSREDQPPAPLSAWTYAVEVWKTDANRACSLDVAPE